MARAAINRETGVTQKQDMFCQAFIETGNASDAYRRAYDAENMKPASVNRKAKELMDNGRIAARVEQLRAPIIKKLGKTVQNLVDRLDEVIEVALAAETPQSAAAVSAIMGQAKLLGHDRPQAAVEDNPLLALLQQIQGRAPLRIVSGETIDQEDDSSYYS